MGIKGLFPTLKRLGCPLPENEPLREVASGKVVAVDASIIMYAALAVANSAVEEDARSKLMESALEEMFDPEPSIEEEVGVVEAAEVDVDVFWDVGMVHYARIVNSRILQLLLSGVSIVVVFDGAPHPLKLSELARREAARVKVEKKGGKALRLEHKHTYYTKQLLSAYGVPWAQSNTEAEFECIRLVRAGKADMCMSEDSDFLAHGCPTLLRRIQFGALSESGSDSVTVQKVEMTDVLAATKMTQRRFIEFCVLCGCDYISNIKQIGPVRALKICGDEQVVSGELTVGDYVRTKLNPKKHPIPEVFPFEEVCELFATVSHEPPVAASLERHDPMRDLLVIYLSPTVENTSRIDEALSELMHARLDALGWVDF